MGPDWENPTVTKIVTLTISRRIILKIIEANITQIPPSACPVIGKIANHLTLFETQPQPLYLAEKLEKELTKDANWTGRMWTDFEKSF